MIGDLREWSKPRVYCAGRYWLVDHVDYLGCAVHYSIYMKSTKWCVSFEEAIAFALENTRTQGHAR